MVKFFVRIQKRLSGVCTLHASNEKDAMTSQCIDWKEVQCPTSECTLLDRSCW